jgi:hypothetical protein
VVCSSIRSCTESRSVSVSASVVVPLVVDMVSCGHGE